MNQVAILEAIKKKAKRDQKLRFDRRFLDTMGFLVAKGFLRVGFPLLLAPNRRLRIEDAVWAGQNVEPRILEVLPAAVLRLGRHFDLDPVRQPKLARIIEQLRKREDRGDAFFHIPYEKLKVWVDMPLRDKRMKPIVSKKVAKTFRLSPLTVERLRTEARKRKCSETDVLEMALRFQDREPGL